MTQVVAGNEPSYELTGLEIYTTYSISIQGRTILLGEASTTVNATTDEDGMCCTKCMIYVYSHHTTSVADLGGVRGVQMHPPLAANNVFLMHCSNNNQAQFIHSHMILTDVQTGLELLKLEIFS